MGFLDYVGLARVWGKVKAALNEKSGSYYRTFTAADWTNNAMIIPAATHKLAGSAVAVQAAYLKDGVLTHGTWAGMATYATMDPATKDITLHSPEGAYAGAVLILG